jgi:hypothetical protein
VKYGSEYQQNNNIEQYKLSSLQEQYEGFPGCEEILEVGVLMCDAWGYEGRLVREIHLQACGFIRQWFDEFF